MHNYTIRHFQTRSVYFIQSSSSFSCFVASLLLSVVGGDLHHLLYQEKLYSVGMVHKEHHKWDSAALRHEFNLNVYGTAGRPCIVFPSSEGHYIDFENWGMVDTIKDYIDQGKVQLFCVDAVDEQSLFNKQSPFPDRAFFFYCKRYEECIVKEVVPFVRKHNTSGAGIILTGCSWGAYHSVNMICKYPEVFDTCVALSGVYSLNFLFGDWCNDNLYFSDPLKYLPGLNDKKTIDALKKDTVIIAVGQGAWEAESIHDSKAVAHHLKEKGIDMWLDVWGEDVAHDWNWWRVMFPYFMEKVLNGTVPKAGK